jgi:hypothetical protein
MSIENVSALIAHARTAPPEEADMALDIARAAIRRTKIESLSALINVATEEQIVLNALRGLLGYAIGTGRANQAAHRLHALIASKPAFEPKSGIRAAAPAFEWARQHRTEINSLLAAL